MRRAIAEPRCSRRQRYAGQHPPPFNQHGAQAIPNLNPCLRHRGPAQDHGAHRHALTVHALRGCDKGHSVRGHGATGLGISRPCRCAGMSGRCHSRGFRHQGPTRGQGDGMSISTDVLYININAFTRPWTANLRPKGTRGCLPLDTGPADERAWTLGQRATAPAVRRAPQCRKTQATTVRGPRPDRQAQARPFAYVSIVAAPSDRSIAAADRLSDRFRWRRLDACHPGLVIWTILRPMQIPPNAIKTASLENPQCGTLHPGRQCQPHRCCANFDHRNARPTAAAFRSRSRMGNSALADGTPYRRVRDTNGSTPGRGFIHAIKPLF